MRRLALALFVVLATDAGAQCADGALPALSRGDRVTILKTDGTTVRGRFESANVQGWSVAIDAPSARRARREITLAAPDIARLELRGPPNFRGGTFIASIVGGALAGALLGQFVFASRHQYATVAEAGAGPPGFYRDRHAGTGAALGSAAGVFVGLALAPHDDPPRTWPCSDSP